MKTILLVDDEPSMRQLYRDALEDEGYHIVEAENGEAALRAFRSHPPDLVVTDIRMPGTNGLDLLSQLHTSYPDLPVILCSGIEALFNEYAVWEARGQVVGQFAKPVSLAALLECIRQALEPILPATSI